MKVLSKTILFVTIYFSETHLIMMEDNKNYFQYLLIQYKYNNDNGIK